MPYDEDIYGGYGVKRRRPRSTAGYPPAAAGGGVQGWKNQNLGGFRPPEPMPAPLPTELPKATSGTPTADGTPAPPASKGPSDWQKGMGAGLQAFGSDMMRAFADQGPAPTQALNTVGKILGGDREDLGPGPPATNYGNQPPGAQGFTPMSAARANMEDNVYLPREDMTPGDDVMRMRSMMMNEPGFLDPESELGIINAQRKRAQLFGGRGSRYGGYGGF